MTMPFQWPANYEPAIVAPDPQPEDAWWFVFRGNDLLVCAAPPILVPRASGLGDFAFEVRRTLYLGSLSGTACFCVEVDTETGTPEGWAWQSLRTLYGVLDDSLFALAGRALQLVGWDRTHEYCGACGTKTKPRSIERSRECPACGLLAYPRIAPAVMCLARRGRELLLARGPHFAQGMYSALAGFAEPGETLEQCVEREVGEEVAIRVANLRYFGSQPWPFPHSLMIAFFADYAGGEIVIDRSEIEDARWFAIDALPRLPAKVSLAQRLIVAAMAEIAG